MEANYRVAKVIQMLSSSGSELAGAELAGAEIAGAELAANSNQPKGRCC